jgi:hypothetical protein
LAVKQYDKAASLCDMQRGIICSDDLERGYRKAYNGAYNDMLADAQAMLKAGLHDRAEELVNEARAYQKEHNVYIVYTVPADTTNRKLQLLKYNKYITDGRMWMNSLIFRPALQYFEKARDLSGQYNFKKDLSLDSLLAYTATPIIKEDMQLTREMIESEKLDSASKCIANIRSRLKNYGLSDDPVLGKGVMELEQEYNEAKCVVISRCINVALSNGNSRVRSQNYIAAISFFREAYRCVDTNRDCTTDSVAVYTALKKYADVGGYQAIMKTADEGFGNKDTLNYFRDYLRAEKYFSEHEIARFGLSHVPLAEWINQSNKISMLTRGFEFFIQSGKYTDCLCLLTRMKDLGMEIDKTFEMQDQLGEALAKCDKKISPPVDPKTNAQNYSKGDKWFAVLKKSYLKNFRSE